MKNAYLLLLLMYCLPVAAQYQWEQKKEIPGAKGRWGAFCFAVNNKIYVGGGYAGGNVNKDDFWEYDPATDKWTQKADLPGGTTRSGALGFTIGNKGYMGFGSEDIFSQPYLNDLWEYDPTANTWARKADMPDSGRTHATWFVVNNKAYIIGGSTSYSFWQSRKVWEYDAAANQWTQKADYPTGIEYGQGFAIGNYGYVAGGADSGVYYKATYQYDPAANTWTPKADFCDGRLAGVAFVMGNVAYVGAGVSKPFSSQVYNKGFCKYDPSSDSWTAAPDIPGAARAYGIAAVANGKAYAGAGFFYNGAENYLNDWYAFGFPTGISTAAGAHEGFSCYPNPATSQLTIEGKAGAQLSVRNVLGQEVYSSVLNNSKETIDISRLSPGHYTVQLVGSDGSRSVVKLEKQ